MHFLSLFIDVAVKKKSVCSQVYKYVLVLILCSVICFEQQFWCSVTSAFQFYKKITQYPPTPSF